MSRDNPFGYVENMRQGEKDEAERKAERQKALGLVKCPECQLLTTPEELAMFNGFCEDCREEQEGDYD